MIGITLDKEDEVLESSPFRNKKRQKRQKAFKVFIYCVVFAVLIVSGVNLINPAYGKFLSPRDVKMDVQACMIFPKTIEGYKEQTDELRWESEDLLNELLVKISELEIVAMIENMAQLTTDLNEAQMTDSTTDYQGDMSTIEGLQALQSSLRAEISGIESTIAANEQEILDLENAITEVESLLSDLENLIEYDFQAVKEQTEQKLEEILELIKLIEEIKDRVLEECDYDPQFFTDILAQMDFNKQVTEKTLQHLEEEHTRATDQIQQITDQVTGMNERITSIQSENESLAGQIIDITNTIASIDQQINDLAEQIRLEEERKKLEEHEQLMEELRKLDEEIRIDEEIKRLEKEKENKGSEELGVNQEE